METPTSSDSGSRRKRGASPSQQHEQQPSHQAARLSTTRRCGFPECTKTAKPGGLCISHGGGKKCAVSGCTTSVVSRGFCVAHGGGKRCQREGCTKSAQTGGFCWIHGGGKKCGFQGCTKRAQSGGACISHGGGKRCRIDGCNKVVQYDGLCVGHGGYRRCLSINCIKKALANSYCQLHGGHSQCTEDACGRKAVKGGLCTEHKSAAAAAAAAITPVQQPVAAYPHHNIEPREDKHQGSASSSSSSSSSPSPANTGAGFHSPFEHSRFHGASPIKSLQPAWQIKPRTLDVLPGYAFAKDRPSLHMDPNLDGVNASVTLAQRHPGSYSDRSGATSVDRHGYAGGGAGFVVGSPILPAIRTISPLSCFGDSQARPTLAFGKRSSPASSSSPQPIKRLASLANIAKLSRPLTPQVTSTPTIPTMSTIWPRLSPSEFPSSESVMGGMRWLPTPVQAIQTDSGEWFAQASGMYSAQEQEERWQS